MSRPASVIRPPLGAEKLKSIAAWHIHPEGSLTVQVATQDEAIAMALEIQRLRAALVTAASKAENLRSYTAWVLWGDDEDPGR